MVPQKMGRVLGVGLKVKQQALMSAAVGVNRAGELITLWLTCAMA
jgi:hypothetical protein